MTNAYLSDTNFASALFVTDRADYPTAQAYFEQVIKADDGLIYLSRFSIAEIEYGIALNPDLDANIVAQLRAAIRQYALIELDNETVAKYAEIRAALFDKKAPRDGKGRMRKGLAPEQITVIQPTAFELGIQENDLWIAAIAARYGMTLVSGDRMTHINEVYPSLKLGIWQKYKPK